MGDKKKKQKEGEITQFEKPSKGFKWSLYKFGVLYKNASFDNYIFTIILLILETFTQVFPSIYPLLFVSTGLSSLGYLEPTNIYEFSRIFSLLTPGLFHTDTWLYIMILFYVLVFCVTFFCYRDPKLLLYLHIVLNSRIHMIIMPLVGGSVGYCIHMCIGKSLINIWVCALIIIMTIPYIVIISVLYFLDSNSITKPVFIIAEWFKGYMFFTPFFTLIVSICNFQCIYFPKIVRHVYFGLLFIICVLISIGFHRKMPMILFFSNEFISMKVILVGILAICSNILMEIHSEYAFIIYTCVPILSAVIFIFIHLIFERKRKGVQQILTQLNVSSNESLTVDTIASTLELIHSENTIEIIVKEGLLSGNKIILSDVFMQFCLEKMPKNEWFLAYITFLYGVVFNTDHDVYQFILHLLSLDVFSIPTEYILYQYVYCFNQTSQIESPMLARKLHKYRLLTLKFISAHRKFWIAAYNQDYDSFKDAHYQYFASYLNLFNEIQTIKLMFPYSAEAHCEQCLFYADFMGNIKKADQEFKICQALLNSENQYVATHMFFGFSLFFPGARRITKNDVMDTEYHFMSFQDNYENSQRQGLSLPLKDPYLTSLTHTFIMSKNTQSIQFKYDVFQFNLFRTLLILSCIIYIILLFFHFNFRDNVIGAQSTFNSLVDFINGTIQFRMNINIAIFEMILLTNLENNKTNDYASNDQLFSHVLTHFNSIVMKLQDFKASLDRYESQLLIENLSISNCHMEPCTFTNIFGIFHRYCTLYMYTNSNFSAIDNITDTELNSLSNDLDKLTSFIYYSLVGKYYNSTDTYIEGILHDSISLSSIEIIWGLIVSIICSIIILRMKRNVFDIVKTAQQPIIQFIATKFDKVIEFDQKQIPGFENYNIPFVIPFFIVLYIIMAIFPIIIIVQSYKHLDPRKISGKISPIIQPSETNNYLMYIMANLDYLFYTRDKNKSDSASLENVFLMECSDCLPDPLVYVAKSIDLCFWLTTVISLIIFVFYVRSVVHEIYMFVFRKYLLQFLPVTAARSNPVLSLLVEGKKVGPNEVSNFLSDVKTIPPDFRFFCLFMYNDLDEITQTLGKPEQIMTIRPKNLTDVLTYIFQFDVNRDDVMQFFKDKQLNKPLCVSVSDNQELLFMFNNEPNCLLVKKDVYNSEVIDRIRIYRHIIKTMSDTRRNPKPFEKAILIGFQSSDTQKLIKIWEKAEKHEFIYVSDARYETLILMAGIDNESGPVIANQIKECLLNCDLDGVRYAITVGGPIRFFVSSKNQTTKSRCISPAYDTLKLLINRTTTDTPMITREFYELLGVNYQNYQIIQLSTTTSVEVGFQL